MGHGPRYEAHLVGFSQVSWWPDQVRTELFGHILAPERRYTMLLTKLCKIFRRPGENRGFTAIELLMVIVVIGILAGITVPNYRGIRGRAQKAKVEATAQNLVTAVKMYAADYGHYPAVDVGQTLDLEQALADYIGEVDAEIVEARYYNGTWRVTDPEAFKVYYLYDDGTNYRIVYYTADTHEEPVEVGTTVERAFIN